MGKEKKKTETETSGPTHAHAERVLECSMGTIAFSWDLAGKGGGKSDQPPGVGEGSSFLARHERICY